MELGDPTGAEGADPEEGQVIDPLQRLKIDLWYLDECLLQEIVANPDAVMVEVRFGEGEGPGASPMPLPENAPAYWRMN